MGLEIGLLGMASLATTAIGAGVSAFSAYQQGKAQEGMAKYNAKLSTNQANEEIATSAENARRNREMSRRKIAEVRSKMAGSGVNISTGSYLDAIGQTATELELQTLDMVREGELKAIANRNQASMSLWEGAQAKRAGTMGAIGSLIGGAASVGSSAYQMRYSGLFGTGSKSTKSIT